MLFHTEFLRLQAESEPQKFCEIKDRHRLSEFFQQSELAHIEVGMAHRAARDDDVRAVRSRIFDNFFNAFVNSLGFGNGKTAATTSKWAPTL